jgi:hypothetical protein
MRAAAVLLGLALAGCAAASVDGSPGYSDPVARRTAQPSPAAESPPTIDTRGLRSCPMPPPPPPVPRTIAAVTAWANLVEAARRECAYKHKRLIDRIDDLTN